MKEEGLKSQIELELNQEQTPTIKHLIRLFLYVFSLTKSISWIYLGAFTLLSVSRIGLALIWGNYIKVVEQASMERLAFSALALLLVYSGIHYLTGLLERYVYLYDDIEQLNLVQANRQQEYLNSRLYQKLSLIFPEYFESAKLNDRIEQVFRFVDTRYGGITTNVMLQGYCVVVKTISILSVVATLFLFSPWLCLTALLAPLPTIWVNTLGQKMMFQFMKQNIGLLRKANYFQDLMVSSSVKELKMGNLYGFFYKKWKNCADVYTQNETEMIQNRAKFLMINNFLTNGAILAGNVLAIALMALGKLSLGGLGASLSLVSTLVNDTKELLTGIATLVAKKNEAAQFFDLIDLAEQKNGKKECDEIETLELKNVTYRYPFTERYVLENIHVQIKKGEKIAVVGENGAGKTTLIKLIEGLLVPTEGEVNINGNPIFEYCAEKLNFNRSIVTQDPVHYETFTVKENVFLGDVRGGKKEEKIREALEFAGCEGLPLDAVLGKTIGGTELSGGEWQKLEIARSVYRNGDFMILDEPTSNLDPIAEADIFQQYIKMSEGKTVLFVTHRISLAALAERIIVLKDGKIIQDGSHEELFSQPDSEYARLYQEQAKWYEY